jgi:hypothetical protein
VTTTETQPNTTELTTIQIERAHTLAGAYGHTWGAFCPAEIEGYRELMACKSAAEIQSLVHRRLEAGPCGWGVDAPGVEVDEWGQTCLTHVTGTGRLAWWISPDGSVELRVSRPSGAYMSLAFDSDIDGFCTLTVVQRTGHMGGSKEVRYVTIERQDEQQDEDGRYYIPLQIVLTDDDGYEKRRMQTRQDWLGARSSSPSFPQFHTRHVDALFQAHAALTDKGPAPIELIALQGEVRPDGIIVSRHPAAVDFIHSQVSGSYKFPIIGQASEEDVRGQRVYGNLPLHLAALAERVTVVEFQGDPPRGAEYGAAEMKAAGARLGTYRVQAAPEYGWDYYAHHCRFGGE